MRKAVFDYNYPDKVMSLISVNGFPLAPLFIFCSSLYTYGIMPLTLPKRLLPLLWDIDDPLHLDIHKYRGFLIARIVEKGRTEDIAWLKKTYGLAAIKRSVAQSKNVSKKVKNYWALL
jgi:hypothetical protein